MTPQTSFREERDFAIAAHENQVRLTASLKQSYDFIVCGAGASGSVIARRLAENPHAEVLLVEAGGSDEAETVLDPAQWPLNLGSERDWGFQAQPNPHLNDRALSMSMGKGLGGGSSVNVTVWARGHRSDWDFFASEAGDPAWGYDNVLGIYRSIENWQECLILASAARQGRCGSSRRPTRTRSRMRCWMQPGNLVFPPSTIRTAR